MAEIRFQVSQSGDEPSEYAFVTVSRLQRMYKHLSDTQSELDSALDELENATEAIKRLEKENEMLKKDYELYHALYDNAQEENAELQRKMNALAMESESEEPDGKEQL